MRPQGHASTCWQQQLLQLGHQTPSVGQMHLKAARFVPLALDMTAHLEVVSALCS